MKIKILSIIILGYSCINLFAEQKTKDIFAIELKPIKQIYALGEPIQLEGIIRYEGKDKLKISKYANRGVEIGGQCEGKKYWATTIEKPLKWWTYYIEIYPGWQEKRQEYITWCIGKPKSIRVRYYFAFKPDISLKVSEDIWQGEIFSGWKEITIIKPSGINEEALRSILGQEPSPEKLNEWIKIDANQIIEKYPSSIYAAWALWDKLNSHGGGFMGKPSNAEPEKYFQCLHNPNCTLLYEEQFSGEKKGEWKILRKEKAAEWRDNKIRTILQSHPDFIYADEMRLRLAMDYLALGNYQEAGAELKNLSDSSTDSIAINKAKEYLQLMKKNSLIN